MSSEHILQATDLNFDRAVLRSRLPVVVDFWAQWCSPCRAIAPQLELLAEAHAGKVRVAKVNVDDCPKLANRYAVSTIPTFITIYKGKSVHKAVGAGGLKGIFEAAAARQW